MDNVCGMPGHMNLWRKEIQDAIRRLLMTDTGWLQLGCLLPQAVSHRAYALWGEGSRPAS